MKKNIILEISNITTYYRTIPPSDVTLRVFADSRVFYSVAYLFPIFLFCYIRMKMPIHGL